MGTVHSGKISHLTWTFTKKYWAVLGCTGLYWAVLGHLRYLLGNVWVKWLILPLCNGGVSEGSAQCNMCPLSSLASREVAAVSQGEAESDYWGKLVYIYSWTGTGD